MTDAPNEVWLSRCAVCMKRVAYDLHYNNDKYIRADLVPDIEIEQHLIADKYYRRGLERAVEIAKRVHDQVEGRIFDPHKDAKLIAIKKVTEAIRAEKDKT